MTERVPHAVDLVAKHSTELLQLAIRLGSGSQFFAIK